ncbi:MAG: hypothetical protein HQ549_05185 [Candidatus Omnitrophica bacterium]|nr:hypothetical protein [Candidatus Omnitrophota bacterium]
MKKTLLIFLFLAIALYSFPQNAFGGAWTLPQYKVWGEYSFKWQWAKEDFGDDYKKKKKGQDARSWDFIMEPKVEIGITDSFNLLCSMEYKESKYKEYGRPDDWGPYRRKNNGVSYVKVGGKLRFIEEPCVISGQIKGYFYTGYGNDHGDDPAYKNQPAIGDGDDALELRGLIGKRFKLNTPLEDWTLPCYAGLEAGYRWRNAAVANDIPIFVETGFWPFKWLLIKTELDTIIAHRDTGSIDKDYAVWRIGPVFQIAGDSALREGKRILNIELQYGLTVWGRETSAYQELTLKIQGAF